jgi:hypothetical protein
MAAKKRAAKRSARVTPKRIDLDRIQVWTPRQAAKWSGIKYRVLLRLIKANMVPYIACATERPAASDHRIYLIPRIPFQRWLNSIGPNAASALAGEMTFTGETAVTSETAA